MPLGVEVRNRTAPPSRGAPTELATFFVPIKAGTGPLDRAVELRSTNDYVNTYGLRTDTDNAASFDYLDALFREGGRRVFAARYTTVGTVDSALALFPKDLGPGFVVAPEETPGATTYGKLQDHAASHNRYAIRDVGNGDTIAAMTTLGQAIPEVNADYGLNGGQWMNVPAPAGVIGGALRQVPGSAITAGLITRMLALGNPNRAAAGRDFPLQYALSPVREVRSDADIEGLLAEGINVFAERYRVLQLEGFQTSVPQSEDTPFWQANCGIARMWLTAHALSEGEHFRFKPIDGRRRLQASLKTALDGICLRLYQVDGLYGGYEAADGTFQSAPEYAFANEVGVALNTESTIAQGELRASCEARFSMHAKAVLIDLVSVPVTGRVSTAA